MSVEKLLAQLADPKVRGVRKYRRANSGDLADRAISSVRPGGTGNTFTWGVQLAGGSIYASDMISGLWQLKLEEAP